MPQDVKKEAEARIAALNVPEDVKKRLREGLNQALNAIRDPSTPQAAKDQYARVVSTINDTLKIIQSPTTSPADKATYTKLIRGINESVRLSQDPKIAPADRDVYRRLADEFAKSMKQLQNPKLPPEQRALAVKVLEGLSDGLLAAQDPKTGPKKAQDVQQIQKNLQEAGTALATLQDPNAPQQAKDAARKTLDDRAASAQNPKYLEFLAEVKRYNPSAACLAAIDARTNQAGWPEGSLWGLSDESCSDILAKAAGDNSSRWNALFQCVQQNAFSTCLVYIPQD